MLEILGGKNHFVLPNKIKMFLKMNKFCNCLYYATKKINNKGNKNYKNITKKETFQFSDSNYSIPEICFCSSLRRAANQKQKLLVLVFGKMENPKEKLENDLYL